MSLEFKIDAREIEAASRTLAGAESIITEEMRRAMNESLATGQEFMANYPSPPSGFRMVWKSERQRRFVMMLVSQGLVPYRRTGTLGRSWTTTINNFASGLRGVLGNIRPYNIYVQSEATQATIHRGRWRTVEELAKTQGDKVRGYFENAIGRIVIRMSQMK